MGPILILLICLCSLLVTQPALTETADSIPCPAVEFRCPKYAVPMQDPLSFSVLVDGPEEVILRGDRRFVYDKKRLVFNWKVSGAKIIRGQRTPNIVVRLDQTQKTNAADVVATVDIGMFPPECQREFSCSLRINPGCSAPATFDSYGDLLFEHERLRLDNLAAHLLGGGPDSAVYILAYAGRNSCLWEEAILRAKRAKKYLVGSYKIEEDRIITFDGGYRENLEVEIFLSSRGGCGPYPTPRLKPSETQVGGFCKEKYKNRNEQIDP